MVSLEVWVRKVMEGPNVPGGVVLVFGGWISSSEAIQVELTDKAGEVGRLECICVVRDWRQELSLEEVVIDDDDLAVPVPADGFVCRVVHQTPQFGGKIIGVDTVEERDSSDIRAFVYTSRNS